MKRYILLVIACITTLILTSCANRAGSDVQIQNSLANEYWMQHINLDPNKWTRHASNWFYTNEPSQFDQFASNSPLSSAITVMTVRVPDFNNIHVEGPFRVQVVGRQFHSSVYILGPNTLARHTVTEVRGNTLYIRPDLECSSKCGNLDQVIIRVGMGDLNTLVHSGNGSIEGKDIDSSNLDITSTANGSVLLVGNMVLTGVSQRGSGTISVLGANTPSLDIRVVNNGNLNISGRVNVHRIHKEGNGILNIIGASSDGLNLTSSGAGITTLVGYANLKKLSAEDSSRVYIYWVNSNGIYVDVHDKAHVGIAGASRNLDVEVDGHAIFQGKYLRADNVYVRTRTYSHANVTPGQKLFASAMDNSSIYFFGAPNVVSRYTLGNGAVIPIFSESCPVPEVPAPTSMYKGEGGFAPPTTTAYNNNGGFTPVAENHIPAPTPPTPAFTAVAANEPPAHTTNNNLIPTKLAANDAPETAPPTVASNKPVPTIPAIAPAPGSEMANNNIKARKPDDNLATIAANDVKPARPDQAPLVVASNDNNNLLDNILSAFKPNKKNATDTGTTAIASNTTTTVTTTTTAKPPTMVAAKSNTKTPIVKKDYETSNNGDYTIVAANGRTNHTTFKPGDDIAEA
jgi:hypothetical protein